MFNLPLQTHRNLIEHVTEEPHLRKILMLKFLSFVKQIERSSKVVPNMLLELVSKDTQSITGSNFRKILLETEKCCIKDLVRKDVLDIAYHISLTLILLTFSDSEQNTFVRLRKLLMG